MGRFPDIVEGRGPDVRLPSRRLKGVKDAGHLPTRAELTAGTDLTNAVAAIDGWSLSNQAIETPELGSTFESKIPCLDQADDSSLGFYEDKVADEIEQLLTDRARGPGRVRRPDRLGAPHGVGRPCG